MSEIDDGGQAFPTPGVFAPDGYFADGHVGLSKRDWFAGRALVGLLSHPKTTGAGEKFIAELAAVTYEVADAMLAARKKLSPP